MAIEDFLSDGEKIQWHSAGDVKIGEASYMPYLTDKKTLVPKRNVKTGKASYILHLTDERILAHKRTGLVFKRDRAEAIKYEEVERMDYSERGIFWKKGVLQIETPQRVLAFKGNRPDMKALWQRIQKNMKGSHLPDHPDSAQQSS